MLTNHYSLIVFYSYCSNSVCGMAVNVPTRPPVCQHVTIFYPQYLLVLKNMQYCRLQYPCVDTATCTWLVVGLLDGVYRPTREFFTHMETSPLPVKRCKFLTYARHLWPLSNEGSLMCHIHCDTGLPFIMVISEDP